MKLISFVGCELMFNPSRRTVLVACWLVAIVGFLFLATYNLGGYPVTWFDEGSHLHVPKDLVQFGVYADRSSEGWRYFGPTVGVGPTVMLPIALAFKLAGIGLVQARLVIVAYMLAALILFGFVAKRLYGGLVAVVALLFLASTPSVALVDTGRQVLGEVPALAFLLLGILLWFRSVEPGRGIGASVLAGVGFALMALTKNQFALVLLPTLVVLFVVDRLYYRQASIVHFLVPVVTVVAFVAVGYGILFLLAAQTEDLARLIALYRNASAGAILVLSPRRMAVGLRFLAGQDQIAVWGIPSIIYGLALARERTRDGLRQAFLVTFVLIGLGWFAFGSIGWNRYAFAPLAILPIFAAKLFRDVVDLLEKAGGPAIRIANRRLVAAALAVTLGTALIVADPLFHQARQTISPIEPGPREMALYLDTHVAPSEIVETWEPELGFLSNGRFHFPPPEWLDRAVRAKWLGATGLIEGYAPLADVHPAYLVVGPWGRFSGIYDKTLADLKVQPIATFGPYDVYRIP